MQVATIARRMMNLEKEVLLLNASRQAINAARFKWWWFEDESMRYKIRDTRQKVQGTSERKQEKMHKVKKEEESKKIHLSA
jgi:hypothetical protein